MTGNFIFKKKKKDETTDHVARARKQDYRPRFNQRL